MKWGNWIFESEQLTLWNEAAEYEIDLEGINSNAVIVDWIFQVNSKTWADARNVHDLIRAFRDILKPQANCCSFGADKQFNGSDLAKQFAAKHSK
jgi:hypothetical protein